MVLNETNSPIEATMYQPYGNQITLHKSPKDVKEKFTGKEFDQDGPRNYYVDFDIAISGHTPSSNPENKFICTYTILHAFMSAKSLM